MERRYLLSLTLLLSLPFVALAIEKIDINTASLQDLDKLIGVGPSLGQKIIEGRPFSSVDELLQVSGIGEKTLQKIKDQGLACVENQNSTPVDVVILDIPSTNPPIEERPPTTYPSAVILSELLPSPEGIDEENEWIEIYNKNDFVVDLSNWKIYDTEGKITQYTIPIGIKIKPKGYLVLTRPQTKIILNNTADGLTLYNPGGIVVDKVVYKEAKIGQSYNKIKTEWIWSDKPSPGEKNIETTEKETSATDQINKNLLASFGDIPPNNNKTNIVILIGGLIATTLTIVSYIIRKKLTNTPLGDKKHERT